MNQMMRWRCTCGCDPCQCGGAWSDDWCDPCAGLSAAQRACLKQVLREVINEGTGLIGPIHGVTDGSDATPGDVGEYVILSSTMSYAGYPAITTTTVSAGVLQPGDWNITSWLAFTTAIGQGLFHLSPVPPGVSNNMAGIQFVSAATSQTVVVAVIPGITARGSFAIPTLLPFLITVDQTADTTLTAGTATLVVEARRMR